MGVTGLPSDDAVLDSVLEADGADPDAVDRVTIGFKAVASLAAGRVDAATAFWNAEGLELRRRGIPIGAFRVDDYGAPRYPELVLVTSRALIEADPDLVGSMAAGHRTRLSLRRLQLPLRIRVGQQPLGPARRHLRPRPRRAAQPARRPDGGPRVRATRLASTPRALRAWARWDVAHGILDSRPDLRAAFALSVAQ